MKDRMDSLEKKLLALQSRCDLLEKENQGLVKEMAENKKKTNDEELLVEEETLFNLKKSGFKRQTPQVQPESKLGKKEYTCDKCNCNLESIGLLNAHMETHSESSPKYKCGKCDEVFGDRIRLRSHTKTEHKENTTFDIRQYTCEDCPFQGESSLELKKHVMRTQHRPSEFKEQCYTCKKEFDNYFHLMNHRKEEHPSNKVCRFFKEQACIFEAIECWYKHDINTDLGAGNDYPCNKCTKLFVGNSNLMKHNKLEHTATVARCRNFKEGNCKRTQESCWFLHDEKAKYTLDEDEVTVEELNDSNEAAKDSFFCEAREKSPPDQMSQLIKIITKLSLKVENLEKMTQNIQ